jgi:hypothetical protein
MPIKAIKTDLVVLEEPQRRNDGMGEIKFKVGRVLLILLVVYMAYRGSISYEEIGIETIQRKN